MVRTTLASQGHAMSESAVRVSGLFPGSSACERHLPTMRFPVAEPCWGAGLRTFRGPLKDCEVF